MNFTAGLKRDVIDQIIGDVRKTLEDAPPNGLLAHIIKSAVYPDPNGCYTELDAMVIAITFARAMELYNK
jgi:hypothetical protein